MAKPLVFLGEGSALLRATNLPKANVKDGIFADDEDDLEAFIDALRHHRFPLRAIESVPA